VFVFFSDRFLIPCLVSEKMLRNEERKVSNFLLIKLVRLFKPIPVGFFLFVCLTSKRKVITDWGSVDFYLFCFGIFSC
jgi:hypothetical protein